MEWRAMREEVEVGGWSGEGGRGEEGTKDKRLLLVGREGAPLSTMERRRGREGRGREEGESQIDSSMSHGQGNMERDRVLVGQKTLQNKQIGRKLILTGPLRQMVVTSRGRTTIMGMNR